MNVDGLEVLQKQAREDGVDILVGALIVRSDGRIFGQRRSFSRKLFPGCWDIAGGHVEPGERILDALNREVYEETSWDVDHVMGLVGTFEWSKEYGAITKKVREFEFLVRIRDEDQPPTMETDHTTEYAWFAPGDLNKLLENRAPGDDFMLRVFRLGFQALSKSYGIFMGGVPSQTHPYQT